MQKLQPPRCPTWCEVLVPHTVHSADLDTFDGRGVTVAVELRQDGDAPAVVRVFVAETGVDYGEDYPHADLTVEAAVLLGRAATGLGTPTVFDFAAALSRGRVLAGGGR
ncbi:hypothetical protein [Sphaerisporangium rhizosphaerae]|uniref:Uncharacterized protein n=1 Tax=Sphaerisporangium rhizosphaerae TaxID=2269375 RepID=A0ABW2P0B5_9ACTN